MNAVENPIINSPFEEPKRHFDFSGPEPREVEGRRPAGYYGVANTRDVLAVAENRGNLNLPATRARPSSAERDA